MPIKWGLVGVASSPRPTAASTRDGRLACCKGPVAKLTRHVLVHLLARGVTDLLRSRSTSFCVPCPPTWVCPTTTSSTAGGDYGTFSFLILPAW